MIKLVTLQKRVASLTRPQFEERWRSIHGPIAAKFPGLRGYMLGFSLDVAEAQADGVAQLWFDSREARHPTHPRSVARSKAITDSSKARRPMTRSWNSGSQTDRPPRPAGTSCGRGCRSCSALVSPAGRIRCSPSTWW